MRLIAILTLIAISGVALADDTATRVAVIEKDIKLLRDDVQYLKDRSLTRLEYKALYEMVSDIRTRVTPKLSEIDTLAAWKEGHLRSHEVAGADRDRSVVVWIGLVTIFVAAVSIGSNYILAKRNGNHG
jgi:hypothetical protein